MTATGESLTHARILLNVAQAINDSSRRGTCEAFTGVSVWMPKANSCLCPDILVIRGESCLQENAVVNASVIVEVLSDASDRYDHHEKFRQYRAIPQLRNYVLISHEDCFAELFWRTEEGWFLRDYSGMDASIDLDAIDVKLPLQAVYRGVDFPTASA